jgi:hypothetical protein
LWTVCWTGAIAGFRLGGHGSLFHLLMGKWRNVRKGKGRKLTHNHISGPSLHGRNTAPELTSHIHGPRHLPSGAETPSSKRVQIGSVAAEFANSTKSKQALKNQRKRVNRKNRKLLLTLSPISLEEARPMSRDETMNKKFSYFSGGVAIPFNDKTEIVYSVKEHLKVINNPQFDNHSLGLIYKRDDSISADIILCPRNDITKRGLNKCDKLCDAFDMVLKDPKARVTIRGNKSQNVRTDVNNPLRYICIGTHVNQGGKGGITPFSAVLENTDLVTRSLVDTFVASIEHLFCAYVSHEEVNIVTKAIKLMDAPTFTMPPSKSNPNPKKAKVYGAMAVGVNVFLALHTDKDFAQSAVSVLCRSECNQNEERILAYFAFPALGIAIPLKKGDVLFFNPNEPHCITSRVSETDHIYCVSLYLKSATIGLNNNSIPLTDDQKSVLEYKNNLAI